MEKQMNGQVKRPVTDRELKKMNAKQKLQYMWENHRKHVIAFGIEIAIILGLVILLIMRRDAALTGVALNSSGTISKEAFTELNNDMLEGAQLDSSKAKVDLVSGVNYYLNDESKAQDNYTIIQAIVSQMEKGKLDFLTGDVETVKTLAYSSLFMDLSKVLNEEQLDLFKPYLRYIDQAIVDEIKKAASSNSSIEVKIPDCTKPEEMKKPIPVMIDMSEYDALAAFYPDKADSIVFAVIENTKAKSTLQKTIDFIMKEKVLGGK